MENIGGSVSGILICMAVAVLCLTVFYVYKNSGCSFMISILMMIIISSLVRIVERFNYTESWFDKEGDYYGVIIGAEISIAWICCLLAEWYTAMKYFDVSS